MTSEEGSADASGGASGDGGGCGGTSSGVLPASATRAVGHQQLVPLLACWAGACFRSGGSDDDVRDGKGGGKSGGGSGTARAAAVGLTVASVLA